MYVSVCVCVVSERVLASQLGLLEGPGEAPVPANSMETACKEMRRPDTLSAPAPPPTESEPDSARKQQSALPQKAFIGNAFEAEILVKDIEMFVNN